MQARVEPTLDAPSAEAAGQFASDPLAQALAWLTRHHGRDRSAESLLSGQPVSGPCTDLSRRSAREGMRMRDSSVPVKLVR